MFRGNVVENRWRGDLVEEIVNRAIDRSIWHHCSENWNSWDFAKVNGHLKIQVKQAALRQTWGVTSQAAVRFGIKKSKGYYVGSDWKKLPEPARIAEIYLFAFHSDCSDAANHWDANEWSFFGVRESDLSELQSISLRQLNGIASGRGFADVKIDALNECLSFLASKTEPNGRVEKSELIDPGLDTAEAPDDVG